MSSKNYYNDRGTKVIVIIILGFKCFTYSCVSLHSPNSRAPINHPAFFERMYKNITISWQIDHTCHGPFRSHLAKIQLVDEPSCPNCGSHEDKSRQFLLNCPELHEVRKLHLTALCEFPNRRPSNTKLPIIAPTFVIWHIMYIHK